MMSSSIAPPVIGARDTLRRCTLGSVELLDEPEEPYAPERPGEVIPVPTRTIAESFHLLAQYDELENEIMFLEESPD
jgi:hypothetical protein